MSEHNKKSERLDFIGAFEQSWIQYKANFLKLIPYGLMVSIPSLFFFVDISVGVIVTIVLQGFLFVLLANVVFSSVNGTRSDIYSPRSLFIFLKNGIVISIFLFPLLAIGALLVVPSVIIFSIFMFSFFITATKEKFAVDALMDSLREGIGYRLHLFLFSLIFYCSIAIGFLLSSYVPLFFIVTNSLLIPYFFLVIHEFYEQLEKK